MCEQRKVTPNNKLKGTNLQVISAQTFICSLKNIQNSSLAGKLNLNTFTTFPSGPQIYLFDEIQQSYAIVPFREGVPTYSHHM